MRRRLQRFEFSFDVEYKKRKSNTKANALSRLRTLGETKVDVEEGIPCFYAGPSCKLGNPKNGTRTALSQPDAVNDITEDGEYFDFDSLLASMDTTPSPTVLRATIARLCSDSFESFGVSKSIY